MNDFLKIQGWLKTIETQVVGSPKWIPEKQVFEYETVSVEVVTYLKAVRAVQSLTSIRLLLENGLFIDFYTIARCVFDSVAEIEFLLEDYPIISSQVEKFLRNFREATIDEVSTQSTAAVLSKKIRNASARVWEGDHLNFDQHKAALDNTYKNFQDTCMPNTRISWRFTVGRLVSMNFKLQVSPVNRKSANMLSGLENWTIWSFRPWPSWPNNLSVMN